jgi:tRNA pseudouridine13 synthase
MERWARAFGPAVARGVVRGRPEDFRVREIPLVTPAGQGNHLWLEIEKTGCNTQWVAGELARVAGVASRDLGFAGLKDRNAVTTQWFSIGLQEAASDAWSDWRIPGVTILQAVRHTKKLRRGALAGNAFTITVRDCAGARRGLERRLDEVAEHGVPNYFGPQRFGHDGGNIGKAQRWLMQGARVRRNRKGIYLSALRSFLFNEVLSARVEQGSWERLLDGEVAMLDGSHSHFLCEGPDPKLEARCEAFDIHPSGPLPGAGGSRPGRQAAEVEDIVLEPYRELTAGLASAGVEAARRALRVRPKFLVWRLEADDLELGFELPAGAYATTLLREILDTGL